MILPVLQFVGLGALILFFLFFHYWMIVEGENVRKQQQEDQYNDLHKDG